MKAEEVKEIKDLIEESKSGITTLQSELNSKGEKYDSHILKTDEALKKQADTISETCEKLEAATNKFEAEQKTIEKLQLAIANGAGSKSKGELVDDPEVKTAFQEYLLSSKRDFDISDEIHEKNIIQLVKQSYPNMSEKRQDAQVKKILSEGAFNSAGIFCPVTMAVGIERRERETTPILEMATVTNTQTSSMEIPAKDEFISVNTSGETDDRLDTSAAGYFSIKIETNELNAEPMITNWMRDDSSIDIEGEIIRDGGDEFAHKINSQMTNGSGDKEAKGFMNANVYADADPDVYARGKIGTYETAAALDFSAIDLINLQSYPLEAYQVRAQWLMHRRSWAKVTQLRDDTGQFLLNPRVMFEGAQLQLLGNRVRLGGDMVAPDNAGAYTSGQRIMAFGDFQRCYRVVRRTGVNLLVDPYTKKGFVKYHMTTRIGGGMVNYQGLKRLKIK